MARNGNRQNSSHGYSRKEELPTEPQERGGLEEIQEIEEKIESEYLDYSRKVQDQLERIQEASRAREEELRNLFRSEFERKEEKKEEKKEFSPYQDVPSFLFRKLRMKLTEIGNRQENVQGQLTCS